MAKRYEESNPLHVPLYHRDGKFAGYIDVERNLLLLFSRGLVVEYPFEKLIAQARKRAELMNPVVADPPN